MQLLLEEIKPLLEYTSSGRADWNELCGKWGRVEDSYVECSTCIVHLVQSIDEHDDPFLSTFSCRVGRLAQHCRQAVFEFVEVVGHLIFDRK